MRLMVEDYPDKSGYTALDHSVWTDVRVRSLGNNARLVLVEFIVAHKAVNRLPAYKMTGNRGVHRRT